MDLLEYQAKELFAQIGIPILPSQCINHPADLKGLKIPYPVVLKSQVRAGGRGKAGGVKFAENTIDAVAAAQAIVNLPIMGDYPDVILAEAKYNADRELYLAVVLDTHARRPVLLGSNKGGVDLDAVMEHMQVVVVDRSFSPFYARRLVLKMGLQGRLIQSVSQIIEKMYRLFVDKDLDVVEINPLGVSPDGSVMALDGKVTVNDEALSRHPDVMELLHQHAPGSVHAPGSIFDNNGDRARDEWHYRPQKPDRVKDLDFHLMDLEGTIGVLSNGTGLMMATLDLIYSSGGNPARCLEIAGDFQGGWLADQFCERIDRGLELVLDQDPVEVILVNLMSGLTPSDRIAETILKVLEQRSRSPAYDPIPIILRLVGDPLSPAIAERLAQFQITWIEDLEAAIKATLAPSKL
ncbi:acetate--CoA ligase family protein [Roseofilum sp. BLCC_M154]|uniref:Acetate--CoA ligase family protein n=1 Tax=Roseofilum acuticapitatum BLCC-M154 TaxID=3022444 RepID=A0ABT7B199_9CYAN|nr:ATP-grasp domain-containing protein [Roseofilum acuticapitatum]MDJ1172073.1 acetate--CoA ligase family protein [Roseofilum acuticapitatum BLCC-M154]